MRTSKAPHGRLLLAIYTITTWSLSAALLLLRGPDALLVALMAPIVFAGLFYPRRTYLLMTLVADVAALWVLQSLSLSLYASVQILAALTLIVIILVEIARRLIAARTRAEMTNLLNTSIARHATVDYRLAPTLSPVDVDGSQIRQVVMNLVVNASEALGDTPGRIRIATGELDADRAYLTHTYFAPDLPVGTYVFVEVTDTGCGMDSETRAKIFEPFFTTKFTGRGLGLAAVLGIVRGHRGALKVESILGRGSTFRVLLPATGDARERLDTQRGLHPTEAAQTPTFFVREVSSFCQHDEQPERQRQIGHEVEIVDQTMRQRGDHRGERAEGQGRGAGPHHPQPAAEETR
jgi:hypothetical protein